MEFNNSCSQQSFIGNRKLEEVISKDKAELVSIGGSFNAIADRMQQFIDFAKAREGVIIPWEKFQKYMKPLFDKYRALYGETIPEGKPWQDYVKEWDKRMSEHPMTWLDDRISVIQYIGTRGYQQCPYNNCREGVSTFDVSVFSRLKNRGLKINPLTIHLVRNHNLLEKDNEYGISAKEFYEGFM